MLSVRLLFLTLVVLFLAYSVFLFLDYPTLSGSVSIVGREIKISRNSSNGLVIIEGKENMDFLYSLGYIHAHDRLVQMALQRIVGEGRIAELLVASSEAIEMDKIVRTQDFKGRAERFLSTLSEEHLVNLQRYCKGINSYINNMWIPPFEFILSGLKLEPWKEVDVLVTIQLTAFIGLSQLQQDTEKFVILLTQTVPSIDKSLPFIQELFPQAKGLDERLASYIRKLSFTAPMVPKKVYEIFGAGDILGSNNWVVSGDYTVNGYPMLAMDPHLQINRLPPVFHEILYKQGSNYAFGITIPGIPGLIMGRMNNVAFSLTYGMMDQLDHFIEHVENGKVRRGDSFIPLRKRSEVIQLKGSTPLIMQLYETEDGCLLELPVSYNRADEIPDGYYISSKTSWNYINSENLKIFSFQFFDSVDSAIPILRTSPVSCNFLIGDRNGNIAYQQSGLLPNRNHEKAGYSPFIPVPAWEEGLVWSSIVNPKDLINLKNPSAGFIATANHDVQQFVKNNPRISITCNCGPYRYQRAVELLSDSINKKKKMTYEQMQQMQIDSYSLQAERYMNLFNKPGMLPDTIHGKTLAQWDKQFVADSRGALLFQALYSALTYEVIGKSLSLSREGYSYIHFNSSITLVTSAEEDAVLLDTPDDSPWFGSEGRTKLFKRVAYRVLGDNSDNTLVTNEQTDYGTIMPLTFTNIFFQGKLPSWLGFDIGSFRQNGNPNTLYCGRYRNDHGKVINAAASWRAVTDLATDTIHSILAGGQSGRRLSQFYASDVNYYLAGKLREKQLA